MARVDINVNANTTAAQRGLARLRNQVSTWTRGVRGMFLRAFAVGAIIASLRSISNELDRIHKLSQRFGVGTTFLQDLSQSAQLAGTDIEQVVRPLSRLIGELNAVEGPGSRAASALNAIGLSVEDVKGLNAEQLFEVLAERVGGLADENEALAVAQALLGSRAAELLPLLQQTYEEGMQRGTRATREQIEAVADFNDAQSNLGVEIKTFLLPAFQLLMSAFQALRSGLALFTASWVSTFRVAREVFTGFYRVVRDISRSMLDVFGSIGELIAGVFTLDIGRIEEAWESGRRAMRRGFEGIANEARSAMDKTVIEMRTGIEMIKEDFQGLTEAGQSALRAVGIQSGTPREQTPTRRREGQLQAALGTDDDSDRIRRELEREQNRLIDSLERLADVIKDPGQMGISSLQQVGGGGIAADVNRDAIVRVGQQQLRELQAINQKLSEAGTLTTQP